MQNNGAAAAQVVRHMQYVLPISFGLGRIAFLFAFLVYSLSPQLNVSILYIYDLVQVQ